MYYEDKHIKLFNKDCRDMSELPDESVDLLITDPPYGIGFMGKDWDKALPDKGIWRECMRILKPGAFAFVMCIPRADCLSRVIISLEDAGFRVDFTPIYWAYASGFPKAQNIGKKVDKRLGVESKVIGKVKLGGTAATLKGKANRTDWYDQGKGGAYTPELEIKEPASLKGKALDGSYGGFQPKPAVEVILVCMKPLSEKTFVDQALSNRKGVTWLGDGRIPYESEGDLAQQQDRFKGHKHPKSHSAKSLFTDIKDHSLNLVNPSGRFPANLLVSDDMLNDGRVLKTGDLNKRYGEREPEWNYGQYKGHIANHQGDSGSFSRYFDLDSWWAKTFPFLIAPKASKAEKSKGCEEMYWLNGEQIDSNLYFKLKEENNNLPPNKKHRIALGNIHPTCKPVKLMSYLVTLGSREGDVILDNFGGSGTTGVAAKLLGRHCIMYEIDEAYCEIAAKRCSQQVLL